MKALYLGVAFFIILACLALYWVAIEKPPKQWTEFSYSSESLETMKAEIPGYAGDFKFKAGWGWIHEGYLTESWLLLTPYYYDEDGEITEQFDSVSIQTWLDIPLFGRKRIYYRTVNRLDSRP